MGETEMVKLSWSQPFQISYTRWEAKRMILSFFFFFILDNWLSVFVWSGENLTWKDTLGHSPVRCPWGAGFASSCTRCVWPGCLCVASHCAGAPGQLWTLGGADGKQRWEGTQVRSITTARRWCLLDTSSSAPCSEGWSSWASSVEKASEIQPHGGKGRSRERFYLPCNLRMSLINLFKWPKVHCITFPGVVQPEGVGWGGLGFHQRLQCSQSHSLQEWQEIQCPLQVWYRPPAWDVDLPAWLGPPEMGKVEVFELKDA